MNGSMTVEFELNNEAYETYYREREGLPRRGRLVRYAFSLLLVTVAVVAIMLGQWAASLLIGCFLVLFWLTLRRKSKTILNAVEKAGIYTGQVVCLVEPDKLTLILGLNLIQMQKDDFTSYSETLSTLQFRHRIGFSFFVPKAHLLDEALQNLRSFGKSITTSGSEVRE